MIQFCAKSLRHVQNSTLDLAIVLSDPFESFVSGGAGLKATENVGYGHAVDDVPIGRRYRSLCHGHGMTAMSGMTVSSFAVKKLIVRYGYY